MTPGTVGMGSPLPPPRPLQLEPLARVVDAVPERYWVALAVLVVGGVLAYLLGALFRRVLVRFGLPGMIEGTAFERTARDVGTSTVELLSWLVRYFVIGVAVLAALSIANVNYADPFWNAVASFLPQVFFAAFIVIAGVVVGDKVELVVAERLRGIKLPQMGVIPSLAKYSVIYLAVLIALSQVGIATLALVVLLAAYFFAVIFLGGIAFKDMLASGAAGTYLLLHQPYSIGDEVRVGDRRGIVQEIDLFVTHVEDEGEEHIIPNHRVLDDGIVRVR